MVTLYDMGKNSEDIIDTMKKELVEELKENITEIQKLKEIMLKDEVIVF